jgi:hypothetical protein
VSLSYFVVFYLELLSLNVFNVVYISELKKKSMYLTSQSKAISPDSSSCYIQIHIPFISASLLIIVKQKKTSFVVFLENLTRKLKIKVALLLESMMNCQLIDRCTRVFYLLKMAG